MIVTIDRLYALAQKIQGAEEQCSKAGLAEVGIELDLNEIAILKALATDYVEAAQNAQKEQETQG